MSVLEKEINDFCRAHRCVDEKRKAMCPFSDGYDCTIAGWRRLPHSRIAEIWGEIGKFKKSFRGRYLRPDLKNRNQYN